MTQKKNSLKQKITSLELSIQIHLSGLSFCVLQRDSNNTIKNLQHYRFEKRLNPFEVLDKLKSLFNTEDFLKHSFDTVHVVYINELSTLVPNSLFNEAHLADYLKFNAKILKTDFIAFDKINTAESVNVYVPYVNINNFIYDTFGTFTYKHFSSILIEEILMLEKNSETTKVYIHVGFGHFEIVAVKNGKLLLYNTYQYNSKEDFIYYILFAFEQLELDPETNELIVLGDISDQDELYKIAYKYIRHVSIIEQKYSFKLSDDLKSKHSNFILLNSF